MANTNDKIATDSACLRSTTSHSQRNNNNVCSDSMEDVDENDVMMGDDDNDNNSIPTTMGVRAACMEFTNRNRSAGQPRDRIDNYASNDNISVAENMSSFFIPLPIPAAPGQVASSTTSTDQKQSYQQQQQMSMDDNDCPDDISTLTEYSMEENDEDNLSQTTANTAWTGVTEVTGSTTAAEAMDPRNLNRRRMLANKRTRVQQSQETGNPGLFRDNRINRGSDKLKRRRKA